MKRSASQELCSDAKRVDDELSSSDFSLASDEEIPAAPIEPTIPVPDSPTPSPFRYEIIPLPSDLEDSSSSEEPSTGLNRYPPEVTFEQKLLPHELPPLQLSRRSLVAIRAEAGTYFSVLSSDVFGCVLASVYGAANLRVPLGIVDAIRKPDATVELCYKVRSPAIVRHVREDVYIIIDKGDWSTMIRFSDCTCGRSPETFSVDLTGTNCERKTYGLGSQYLELRFDDSKELIARYNVRPYYMFTDAVVFTTNCVALLGTSEFCSVSVLVVLYFSPDLKLDTLHLLTAGWPFNDSCVDRDDNLYILAGGNITVYTCDDNYCDFVRRIPVEDLVCFGVSPRGDLVAVSRKQVDLYKKKELQ
jgi:hypothetical protein